MGTTFTAACVQTTSGPEVADNIKQASDLARRARDAGGDLIMMPEVVNAMDLNRKALAGKVSKEADDVALAAFRDLAKETGAWLLLGSLALKHDTATDEAGRPKFVNRSFLIDEAGQVRARYDKMHMFDVDLDGGESYRESKAYEPGAQAVLAETPWGQLGMTICYDLRFPYLYRHLAHEGASFVSIPAAFTRPTGRDHWHVLMRARAIENGCFVFAPAQCGDHTGGRFTFGHSLIVDPWGHVLADGGDDMGFVTAVIDTASIEAARGKIPSLTHDRNFA